MKNISKLQITFIIISLVLGLILNRKNCIQDLYCDPDPLYGGCSSSCESRDLFGWLTKSFGLLILLNFGSILHTLSLKERSYLKKFLESEGLKYEVREIEKEWVVEEKKEKEEFDKMIESIKRRKTKK